MYGLTILIFLLVVVLIRHMDIKLLEEQQVTNHKLVDQLDVLDRLLTMKERNVSIDSFLKDNQFYSVGIYGLSLLGNHLYEELRKSNYLTKLIGIDRADIYNNYDMELRKNTDDFNDLDLIIVTALADYNSIVNYLRKTYKGKIVSIRDVIRECERFYSYSEQVAYCEREKE